MKKHVIKFNEFINENLDLTEYDNLKLIFKTHRGYVYDYGDNKILKLTTDVIEYNNALIFLNKPSKYFVKYYSVKQINDSYYELIMDKLVELTENECEIVDLIQNSLGSQYYMLNDEKRYSFIKELKNNPEYYEDFATYQNMIDMINLLKRMYIEASHRNIILYDLRCINLGKTKDGNIVHFDIGAG
jgi:hypothetical protein